MQQEFLLWTDERFVGFADSFEDAKCLAHQQQRKDAVYIVDFNAPPETQCLVLPHDGMLMGRLGWSTCLQGLQVAAAALAANVTIKRDQMLKTRAVIAAKYPLGMPPLDSPGNPDLVTWNSLQRDLDVAKARHDTFCERYGALAH